MSSSESLLTAGPGGRLLIPLQNHRHSGIDVVEWLTVGKAQGVTDEMLHSMEDLETTDSVGDDGGSGEEVEVEEGEVNVVQGCEEEQSSRLRNLLNLPPSGQLEPLQVQKLEEFLMSFLLAKMI